MFGFRRHVLFFFLLLVPQIAAAESNHANPVVGATVPADPEQFLGIAAKVNGLASENIGFWHVKATFQLLNDTGKVQESGTYEAFWESPHHNKMSYESPSYTRTIWANDSGNFSTSNPKWPGGVEWMIRRSLFDVTPDPRNNNFRNMSWREVSSDLKAKCLDMVPKYAPPEAQGQWAASYCFNTGTPILRYGSEDLGYYQGVFNSIVLFRGAYVARDVELLHSGKKYFRLHIDSLEPLAGQTENIFDPGPGALPIPRRVLLDTDLRYLESTHEVGIPRPVNRKWRTPQALGEEVIVQVLVNKRGEVVDTNPVLGDSLLKFQGIVAAAKWRFKPYLVEGEPTEFYTELEFF